MKAKKVYEFVNPRERKRGFKAEELKKQHAIKSWVESTFGEDMRYNIITVFDEIFVEFPQDRITKDSFKEVNYRTAEYAEFPFNIKTNYLDLSDMRIDIIHNLLVNKMDLRGSNFKIIDTEFIKKFEDSPAEFVRTYLTAAGTDIKIIKLDTFEMDALYLGKCKNLKTLEINNLKVKELDISGTNIDKLPENAIIKKLVISHSKIREIPESIQVDEIEVDPLLNDKLIIPTSIKKNVKIKIRRRYYLDES